MSARAPRPSRGPATSAAPAIRRRGRIVPRIVPPTAALALALGAGAAGAAFGLSPLGEGVDAAIYDQMATRLAPGPAPQAVIVAIDEASFADLGLAWPWPRGLHAALVEALRGAGASAIAFDVIFADPGADPAGDAALAAAMGPDVVLAADLARTETPQGTLVSGVEPLPALTAAGARRGLVGLPVEADGAIRALPPLPGGFVGAILDALGTGTPEPPPDALIPLPRPPGTYPQASYYQALDPEGMLPPGLFRGRPVLIGLALRASADPERGGPDLFRTPWTARGAGLTPGVELHAHILDAVLARAWIVRAPAWAPPALALLAALAAVALTRGRGAAAAAAATLGGVVLWGAAAAAGLSAGTWLPPAAPALATLLAGAGQAGLDFARERAARRRVTRAFEHYLAPAMVERLARDPAALRLGGELRRVSLLFSDLRGFTTLAEAMKEDPEGLTRLVNRALSPIVQAIQGHEGAVDKFIGDCVMGIWNAPADTPDHAARAVAGGIAAVRAVARLSAQVDAEAAAEGLPPPGLAVGVGVNTGLCVVGNMGAEGRFDYTALGDAVNLAARLEGLTRAYGVDFVAGEDTVAEIGPEDAATLGGFAEIDLIAVKGRSGATRIFVPLALWEAGAGTAALQAGALAAYRARDWDGARAAWRRLAQACPRAAPYAAVMDARAARLAAAPPPEGWTGVWTAAAK